MADFEGLIRQALARQNADDPAIREKIYQSSRNALARMIASGKAQSPEIINRQREALENSIRRIEAGYATHQNAQPKEPSQPPPRHEPPAHHGWTPPPPPAENAAQAEYHETQPQFDREYDAPMPEARLDSPRTGSSPAGARADVRAVSVPRGMQRAPYPGYEGEGGIQEFAVDADDVPAHARPRRNSRRGFTIAAFIVLLLVVGGLVYFLFEVVSGSGAPENQATNQPSGQQEAEPGDPVANADYITVLSPVDTGALVTAGRGKAEIVNQSNTDYVRLISLRPDSRLDETANPILLEIEPGVLQQIAGKRVTVEIQAKSGDSGPANFAVGCEVNGDDICGRRRFRIGLQPEATVFPMAVSSNIPSDARAYLTISTDVTNTALQSGEGSAVDILYARLRLPQEQ